MRADRNHETICLSRPFARRGVQGCSICHTSPLTHTPVVFATRQNFLSEIRTGTRDLAICPEVYTVVLPLFLWRGDDRRPLASPLAEHVVRLLYTVDDIDFRLRLAAPFF